MLGEEAAKLATTPLSKVSSRRHSSGRSLVSNGLDCGYCVLAEASGLREICEDGYGSQPFFA